MLVIQRLRWPLICCYTGLARLFCGKFMDDFDIQIKSDWTTGSCICWYKSGNPDDIEYRGTQEREIRLSEWQTNKKKKWKKAIVGKIKN